MELLSRICVELDPTRMRSSVCERPVWFSTPYLEEPFVTLRLFPGAAAISDMPPVGRLPRPAGETMSGGMRAEVECRLESERF